ncbi:hypothetical protein [Kamptonema formosum]|nr:hypothetical protein [Oscillatoria sp. PCC 10802]
MSFRSELSDLRQDCLRVGLKRHIPEVKSATPAGANPPALRAP